MKPGTAVSASEPVFTRSYLTYYPPRNIELDTGLREPGQQPKLTVNLGRHFTLLDVQRPPNNNTFMVFRNYSSTAASQRAHLAATFRHREGAPIPPARAGQAVRALRRRVPYP